MGFSRLMSICKCLTIRGYRKFTLRFNFENAKNFKGPAHLPHFDYSFYHPIPLH